MIWIFRETLWPPPRGNRVKIHTTSNSKSDDQLLIDSCQNFLKIQGNQYEAFDTKANDKDENPHIRYVISEIFTSEDSEGLNDIPKPAFNITSGKRYLSNLLITYVITYGY